jgi:Tfp pilus assembly protein PilN
MKALNLAGRPFRNERLAETLFAVGSVALLAVTAWHALVIRDLLPARTSELHREVAALQQEEARLREEARSLRTEAPPAPILAEWNLVKELVDRRAFSWTGLFARLEDVIPRDVRLTSISPSVRKGQVELDVNAVVRAPEAGWEFVRVLESGGDFYDVYPRSEADREFTYSMRYRPQERSEPMGPPAPAESPSAPAPAQAPAEREAPAGTPGAPR